RAADGRDTGARRDHRRSGAACAEARQSAAASGPRGVLRGGARDVGLGPGPVAPDLGPYRGRQRPHRKAQARLQGRLAEKGPAMLDHIGVSVRDYPGSKAFYLAALAPLGIGAVMELEPAKTGGYEGLGMGSGGK